MSLFNSSTRKHKTEKGSSAIRSMKSSQNNGKVIIGWLRNLCKIEKKEKLQKKMRKMV